MDSKKNILIFSDWYLPAYKAGGPVKSIAALTFHLNHFFNFYIITGNKDLFSDAPYPHIPSNVWYTLANGEQVFYFSDENISLKNIGSIIKDIPFDYVYLNSFFSKNFTLYPLILKKLHKLKTPVIIAPRGMLSKGALSLKSKKKNSFIALAKAIGLYKNVRWHATSLQEENEIKQIFGQHINVQTISNLVLVPAETRTNYGKSISELKICSVARISKVKNLAFALEVLQEIKIGKIVFDIYGPPEEPNYYQQCKALASKLPANILVSFKGDLQGSEVEQTLKNYHLFFLPTLNENFGHAIAEAMLNGCLPLISDQTPWRNLEEKNIGWDISLSNKQQFISAINEAVLLPEVEFEKRSKAAQHFALQTCIDQTKIELYKKLFS